MASHCRFTPPDDRQVGWNAQSVPAKTISLLDVIHLWYRQGEDFDFERAQCAPNRTCHHYTQVRGWYIYCIYNIWTHDHYPYMGLWEIPFKNHGPHGGHQYGVSPLIAINMELTFTPPCTFIWKQKVDMFELTLQKPWPWPKPVVPLSPPLWTLLQRQKVGLLESHYKAIANIMLLNLPPPPWALICSCPFLIPMYINIKLLLPHRH